MRASRPGDPHVETRVFSACVQVPLLEQREWAPCEEGRAGWNPGCNEGSEWLAVFTRVQVAPGTWSRWTPGDGFCADPASPSAAVHRVGVDLAQVALDPSVIRLPGQTTWVWVNFDLPVWNESGVQEHEVQVLDHRVRVQAWPVEHVWDFGDASGVRRIPAGVPAAASGSRSVGTASPGTGETSHVYRSEGDFSITLETMWAGRYQVVGEDRWVDIPGRATTRTDPHPLTTVTKRARLVHEACPPGIVQEPPPGCPRGGEPVRR